MSDSDSAGDIQSLHEDRELVRLTVAVRVFQNLDPVFTRSRFTTGIFERFRNPEPASFIDCHSNRIDDIGFSRHDLNRKPFGNGHHLRCGDRITRIVRRFVLCMRNQRLLDLLCEQNRTATGHQANHDAKSKRFAHECRFLEAEV